MNKATIIIGLSATAFAVTLGMIVGTQLQTDMARLIGLSVAAGVFSGLLTGAGIALLIVRQNNRQSVASSEFTLTDDQAEILLALLEDGPPATEGSFRQRLRRHREYQAVGGANMPKTADD